MVGMNRNQRRVRGFRFRAVLATGILLLAVGSALAGSITVEVQDEDGYPVEGVRLSLVPSKALGAKLWRFTSPRGITDPQGAFLFENLPTGTYTVKVVDITQRHFVNPDDNPLSPVPEVTLLEADSEAVLRIVLHRGLEVYSLLQAGRADLPLPAEVRYYNRDIGFELVSRFDSGGEARKVIPAGAWEIRTEAKSGYLLVDVERDGNVLPSDSVTIDPTDAWRTTYITWTYTTHCKVYGRVLERTGGELGGVLVTGNLQEAGSWIEEAGRSGTGHDTVQSGVDIYGAYEMYMPSGRWRLHPSGSSVLSSEPEFEEVACTPGSESRADFTVEAEQTDNASQLAVLVRDPDREPLEGAVVGLWREEQGKEEPPVRTSRTRRWGRAAFRNLAAGSYRVVAAHQDHLHTGVRIHDYEPDPDRPRWARVTLRPGASVRGIAVDGEGEPVAGAILEIDWMGGSWPASLEHLQIGGAKRSLSGVTDATGVVTLEGLYQGPYRLRAHLPGERGRTHFVRFRHGEGRLRNDLQVHVTPPERSEVDMRVTPGASLAGYLKCNDGKPVPAAASFRVVPIGWDRLEIQSDIDRGAVLSLDDEPLRGSGRDEFLLGPLDDDAFVVSARPAGFHRWTWFPGHDDPKRAAPIQTVAGASMKMASFPLDCTPRIALIFMNVSRSPSPDMRDSTINVEIGAVTPDRVIPVRGFETIKNRERIWFLNLPEGKVRVRGTLRHPMFLPDGIRTFDHELGLERGRNQGFVVSVLEVGGVVEYDGIVATGRLVPPLGDPIPATASPQGLRFEAVPAGAYRLDTCSDPNCEQPLTVYEEIAVEPGYVLRLGPE